MLQLLAFCNHCLLVTEESEENMTYVHSGSLIWHSSIHHVSISEKYLYICQARRNMFHLLFVEFAEGKYLILTFEKPAWASHKEGSRVHTMVHFPCVETYAYC